MELSILCECRAKNKINKNLLILYYDVTCTIMNFNFCSAWQNFLCIIYTLYYVCMMLHFHIVYITFISGSFQRQREMESTNAFGITFFLFFPSKQLGFQSHCFSVHLKVLVWLIRDICSNNDCLTSVYCETK